MLMAPGSQPPSALPAETDDDDERATAGARGRLPMQRPRPRARLPSVGDDESATDSEMSNRSPEEMFEIRRERARMHAKHTRDRKKVTV